MICRRFIKKGHWTWQYKTSGHEDVTMRVCICIYSKLYLIYLLVEAPQKVNKLLILQVCIERHGHDYQILRGKMFSAL